MSSNHLQSLMLGGVTAFSLMISAPGCRAAPGSGEQAAKEAWSAYDDTVLSGPFTLRFRLKTHDGNIPVGRKWTLHAGGITAGDPPRRAIATGPIPPSGIVEIIGLGGIEQPITAEELKAQRRFAPWYSVFVGEKMLGQVSFFEWGRMGEGNKVAEFLPPADGKQVREREYTLPPEPGDMAPDVPLVDMATSKTIRLSELRGQIVLLEFWSSKCHSCEPLMAKSEELIRRRGKDWLGKALILGASVDNDIGVLSQYLKDKGWEAVRHTWSGVGGTGRYSEAAKAFVITGTPAAVLIGRDGKIVWSGSPALLDIEKSFDSLISQ